MFTISPPDWRESNPCKKSGTETDNHSVLVLSIVVGTRFELVSCQSLSSLWEDWGLEPHVTRYTNRLYKVEYDVCSSYSLSSADSRFSLLCNQGRNRTCIRHLLLQTRSTIELPDFRSFPYPLLFTLPVRSYCRMLTSWEESIAHCNHNWIRTNSSFTIKNPKIQPLWGAPNQWAYD